MDQVINAKLRNQAFGKFIAFFLITTILFVTAVYFDFRIPSRENTALRERIRDYENQIYQQNQFILTMEAAKNLIDSMGKIGQYNALLDREIATQLEVMKSSKHQNNWVYATINKNVFNIFYEYNELYKRIIYFNNELKEVENLKNQLNQCKEELKETKSILDMSSNSSTLDFRNSINQ